MRHSFGDQTRRIPRVRSCIALLLILALVGACGGGGGGSDTPPGDPMAVLAGIWFGVLREADGDLTRVDLTLDDGGRITSYRLAGVDQGVTGTLSRLQAQVYALEVTDGSSSAVGTLVTDASGTHLGFVTQNGEFAVLEHGEPYSPPAFSLADLENETYVGLAARVDASAGFLSSAPGTFAVGTGIDFEGTGIRYVFDDDTACEFSTFHSEFGEYGACTSIAGYPNGDVRWFMTADRKFIAGYVGPRHSSIAELEYLFLRRN